MTLARVRRPTCEARSAARKASPSTYTPPWKYRTIWRGSIPSTVISAVGTPPQIGVIRSVGALTGWAVRRGLTQERSAGGITRPVPQPGPVSQLYGTGADADMGNSPETPLMPLQTIARIRAERIGVLQPQPSRAGVSPLHRRRNTDHHTSRIRVLGCR